MELNITINTDDNYLQHTMAMLCSLYENNKRHIMCLHILQNKLSEHSKSLITRLSSEYENKVFFYDVNDSVLKGVQFRNNRPLSMAAYYRLLLSSTLPKDVDKVLYLDCDMIIVRDICEIFEIDIKDYALAACLDSFPYTQQHRMQLQMEVGERTFCSGIMLINLSYWRAHNVEPGLLEYAKRQRKEVWLHDQDVLNYYFKKKWFVLPPKWNHLASMVRVTNYPGILDFDRREFMLEPMLYHFADVNVKPWLDVPTPYKKLYLKYLLLSKYPDITFKKVSMDKKICIVFTTVSHYFRESICKLIHRY